MRLRNKIIFLVLIIAVVTTVFILNSQGWNGLDVISDIFKDKSIIKYIAFGMITIFLIALILFIIFKKTDENKNFTPVEKIAIIGTFTALSYVLMFFGIPFILPFLKIELSIVVIVAVMLLIDYKTAVLIALFKSAIDYVIKGSAVGYPIDQIAHFIAVFTFITTIYLVTKYLSNKFNDEKKALKFGLPSGVLVTTITMLMLNFLWILPVYIKLYTTEGFYGSLEMDEPSNFFLWVLSIFGPFNLLQWGITAAVSYFVYLKVVLPLRKYIKDKKL